MAADKWVAATAFPHPLYFPCACILHRRRVQAEKAASPPTSLGKTPISFRTPAKV